MNQKGLETAQKAGARVDHQIIVDFVTNGSRVIDVGCGNGALLELLEKEKQVDARGLELSREGVSDSVARGLSVVQGNAEHDLVNYPDNAFDYAILSSTIQAMHYPRDVLRELLRISNRVVVSFPNFGHWKIRWALGIGGKMPVNENLSYSWYETPNIHFCTIQDFIDLCNDMGVEIEKSVALNASGQQIGVNMPWAIWNLFGEQAVFLLKR
jgi:methionine biosynthesis protein MetW